MKEKAFCLALLAAAAVLGATTAQAQLVALPETPSGAVTSSPIDRVAYLEQKMAHLESTVQNCQPVDSCGPCRSQVCCGNPGIIGGYDFVWLKPHFSNAVAYGVFIEGGDDDTEIDYGYPTDYENAPRLWLGYQGCNGLGARIRYWQFDQQILSQNLVSDATTTYYFEGFAASAGAELDISGGIEMHVLDLEFMQDIDWGRTQLTVGAGLRYAKLRFTGSGILSNTNGVDTASRFSEITFEGVGPTVFVDFQRRIRQSRLSVVGGLRGSVLFGRGRNDYVQYNLVAHTSYSDLERDNRTTGAMEANIGLQYDRSLTRGVDAFIRCAWEGQLWYDVGSPT
ncbi:MAG: hypothetical protein JW888_17785, partial [Pirellulales bacterium]|nr:hypothetical protein [Pirellulales bacterium]